MDDRTLSEHTAVSRLAEGRYRGEATEAGGIIGGLLNGGFLLQMTANALVDTVGAPHPVTITGHFLRAVRPGTVTIDTEVLRAGRHATARAAVRNGSGEVVLAVTGTFTDLASAEGRTQRFTEPPPLPEPDDCFSWPPAGGRRPDSDAVSVMDRFQHRLDKRSFGWLRGEPQDQPIVQAWARPAVGAWDPLDLLTLCDVYPPPLLTTSTDFTWIPTLELTLQLRSVPRDDEWVGGRFETREVTGGYLEEDGLLLAEDGRLVAISRQLALVPHGA